MYKQMRNRRPLNPLKQIKLPRSGKFRLLNIFDDDLSISSRIFKERKKIACELVHFAFGSSAGTENDTCVSARIKIFIVMLRTSLVTRKTTLNILLRTMVMLISQKYSSNNCTNFPLNFIAIPFYSKTFLLTLTWHFTDWPNKSDGLFFSRWTQ